MLHTAMSGPGPARTIDANAANIPSPKLTCLKVAMRVLSLKCPKVCERPTGSLQAACPAAPDMTEYIEPDISAPR